MTTRAYLFDYGGTLDGEGWHWFDRTLDLYRRAGCELSEAEIKRAFYHADTRIGDEARDRGYRLRPLLERHVELQLEVLGDAGRRFAAAVRDGFCALSEEGWRRSRTVLEALRPHARLGIVSNFYGNLETVLEEAGLRSLVDTVVESTAVGVAKPDPAIYRLAAELLDLPPRDIVMVGDHFERDVRAARAAGMRAIWLRRGASPPPEEGVAERVISRLDELVDARGGHA